MEKNNFDSIIRYFEDSLPSSSVSEINLMVKYLTLKRLNIDETDFLLKKDLLFSESDLLFFRDAVKRMQNHEPFQHVLGEVEFYGLILKSDKRALIPRPETEGLVDWVVKSLDKNVPILIMDLCAGSGCVALGVKSVLTYVKVIASELSEDAIALINENIEKTNLKIEVQRMDVLAEDAFLNFEKNSFDCWISNPPYIPNKDKILMHENVLDFEPEMALFVEDDDALLFYRKIAQQGQVYLKKGGLLFFEIHEELAEDVIALLKKNNFVNIELRKDLQGKDRMIKAQKLSSQNESERGENRG
ncbi:MAG: peptide chain release factor N(5)-glutamine methyltransferase [Fluviicola sp.]|nr:peptide chain release factor N(5)-glutamine methyltransferase [Fluviicola sp.]